MKEVNLFGQEQELPKKILGKHNIWKVKQCYRLAVDDKSCKTCCYLVTKNYGSGHCYKCLNLGNSNSVATDIRLNHICNLYRASNEI